MNRTLYSAIAALGLVAGFSGNAFASGEQQDFKTCLTELQAETLDAEAAFAFKSMRGNSLRRLTFEMTSGEETQAVVCSVKRGAVVNLDWIAG